MADGILADPGRRRKAMVFLRRHDDLLQGHDIGLQAVDTIGADRRRKGLIAHAGDGQTDAGSDPQGKPAGRIRQRPGVASRNGGSDDRQTGSGLQHAAADLAPEGQSQQAEQEDMKKPLHPFKKAMQR